MNLKNEDKIIAKIARRIPPNFKNLEVLKLGQVLTTLSEDDHYHWHLLDHCLQLEFFRFPHILGQIPGVVELHNGDLGYLDRYLELRDTHFPNEPTIKYFDMKYFQDTDHLLQFDFLIFARTCTEKNIGLLNIEANFFEALDPPYNMQDNSFLDCVQSIRNLHRAARLPEFPNLEKLVLVSTEECHLDEQWDAVPNWPKLNTLKIHFDTPTAQYTSSIQLDLIVSFLFEENTIDREEVSILHLTWERNKDGQPLTRPSIVQTNAIVQNFPNISNLKIVNWDAKNRSLLRLWRGLSNLQELWIEDCQLLGNVGFIGENPDEPIFLRLKGLRKLTLKIDPIGKITNRCFKDVFRHLKLKEFRILSDSPLKTVTEEGILSLLDGDFAMSIQRFPFRKWSLHGVSHEDFMKLGRKFRSIC